MGRKKAGTVKVVLTLHLHPETQRDLLDLLANSPNQARTATEGLCALLYGANGQAGKPEAADGARETVNNLLASWDF